jgi:hypothetical protein
MQLSLKTVEPVREVLFHLLEPRVTQSFDPKMSNYGGAVFVVEILSKLVILSCVHLSWLAFVIEGASKSLRSKLKH